MITVCLSFQNETSLFNQKDTKGKKNGSWYAYYTANLEPTQDSTKASYARVTYYDHGFEVYNMGISGRKKWRLEKPGNSDQNSGIKLLDGEYRWIDQKGIVRSVCRFKNGGSANNTFFNAKGDTTEYFDYTKKYKNQELSYKAWIYVKGKPVLHYMRKGSNGVWALYQVVGPDD